MLYFGEPARAEEIRLTNGVYPENIRITYGSGSNNEEVDLRKWGFVTGDQTNHPYYVIISEPQVFTGITQFFGLQINASYVRTANGFTVITNLMYVRYGVWQPPVNGTARWMAIQRID